MMKVVFFFFFCLVLVWGSFLASSQVDVLQGEVYKILYIHVPNALCAFFSSFLLFLSSLFILLGKKKKFLPYAKASADIGFIFTLLTLVTGSIWGKPTWGTWWTWDARLTTTFLLAILYGAYHFLWQVAETTEKRMKSGLCAGQIARTASTTSSAKRMRLSSVPPYSSLRRLADGERNW